MTPYKMPKRTRKLRKLPKQRGGDANGDPNKLDASEDKNETLKFRL